MPPSIAIDDHGSRKIGTYYPGRVPQLEKKKREKRGRKGKGEGKEKGKERGENF
jgi:hypothetical protein